MTRRFESCRLALAPSAAWVDAPATHARRTPHAARRTPHAARRTPHQRFRRAYRAVKAAHLPTRTRGEQRPLDGGRAPVRFWGCSTLGTGAS